MTYYVTYAINAVYVAEVNADSLEEAKKEAEATYRAADLENFSILKMNPLW